MNINDNKVRLGSTWETPVSKATIARIDFKLIDECSQSGDVVVVDAFPFFNELDVLEARLHELDSVVCVALLWVTPVAKRGKFICISHSRWTLSLW